MTALLDDVYPCEDVDLGQCANEAVVRRLNLDTADPVGLDTLVEHAALMERTDRKYIAPIDAVAELVTMLADSHRVLSVGGRRYTSYRTSYFDTVDFTSAHAHIQRRRRRCKVRTRLYVEDHFSRVEIKTKDNRGNTAKVMGVSDPDHFGTLSDDDQDFVTRHLSDFPEISVRDLVPTAEVEYTRATLSDLAAGTRVTLDWGLSMRLGDGDAWLDDQFVVVETKGPAALSRADRALHKLGVRPRGFSKYVSAASTLRADIPFNDFASLRARKILRSRANADRPS